MSNIKAQKCLYTLGIGLGIIFVTAFLFGQIVLPLVIGRPQKVITPEVVGKSLAQAKTLLKDKKLHVVVKDSLYSETAKIDRVLEQSPAAGTELKEEGTVHLVISKGSKMVKVPDLRGASFQEAMIILRNYDLRSTIADSLYHDDVAQNAVLRSNPSPGTKMEKKSLVKLVLSRGPEPKRDSLSSPDYYFPDY